MTRSKHERTQGVQEVNRQTSRSRVSPYLYYHEERGKIPDKNDSLRSVNTVFGNVIDPPNFCIWRLIFILLYTVALKLKNVPCH